MDIVLKEADIVRLIGQALGMDLNETLVSIQTNPFTITIADVETCTPAPQPPKSLKNAALVTNDEPDLDDLLKTSRLLGETKPNVSTHTPPPTEGGKEIFEP